MRGTTSAVRFRRGSFFVVTVTSMVFSSSGRILVTRSAASVLAKLRMMGSRSRSSPVVFGLADRPKRVAAADDAARDDVSDRRVAIELEDESSAYVLEDRLGTNAFARHAHSSPLERHVGPTRERVEDVADARGIHEVAHAEDPLDGQVFVRRRQGHGRAGHDAARSGEVGAQKPLEGSLHSIAAHDRAGQRENAVAPIQTVDEPSGPRRQSQGRCSATCRGPRLAFRNGLREGDDGGGHVLARVAWAVAVAGPLLGFDVEGHRQRYRSSRCSHAGDDFIGVRRGECHRSVACELDAAGPQTREARRADGIEKAWHSELFIAPSRGRRSPMAGQLGVATTGSKVKAWKGSDGSLDELGARNAAFGVKRQARASQRPAEGHRTVDGVGDGTAEGRAGCEGTHVQPGQRNLDGDFGRLAGGEHDALGHGHRADVVRLVEGHVRAHPGQRQVDRIRIVGAENDLESESSCVDVRDDYSLR